MSIKLKPSRNFVPSMEAVRVCNVAVVLESLVAKRTTSADLIADLDLDLAVVLTSMRVN